MFSVISVVKSFAQKRGCDRFIANVSLDAVSFYPKLGYKLDPGSPENDPKNPRMVKDGDPGG